MKLSTFFKVMIFTGCCSTALSGGLAAAPRTFETPPDTIKLAPGPNLQVAEDNCQTCHSIDYIKMQPPRQGKAFWTAEVNKMIKVYGAPIEPDDAAKIIDYLTQTY